MLRQDIERLFSLLNTRASDGAAEENFGAEIVAVWIEIKAVIVGKVLGSLCLYETSSARLKRLPRPPKAPAGQNASQRDYVLLRVTAIDS